MNISGTIVTPSRSYAGEISFSERIEAIQPLQSEGQARYLLPGFIDLHVHGGGGADCMDGEEATRTMARFHARHGSTALLATTVTAPLEDIEQALVGINRVMHNPGPGEARVLGVHLEGPFINPNKLGAQPPYVLEPNLKTMEHLLSLAPIKVVTLAPELPGALELIRFLTAQGVRVQMGHTTASYLEARAGFEVGARGFTHFYNAMTGLHHREPGVVGFGLEQAEWAELILDGLHIHPASARAAWKVIPKAYAVTDSVSAAGMPEGKYHLGRHEVFKKENGVYLEDETLAGSALTMDQALRNLVAWGYTLAEAVAATSARPAAYLGLEAGLEVGLPADLLVLDANLQLLQVYVQGKPI